MNGQTCIQVALGRFSYAVRKDCIQIHTVGSYWVLAEECSEVRYPLGPFQLGLHTRLHENLTTLTTNILAIAS